MGRKLQFSDSQQLNIFDRQRGAQSYTCVFKFCQNVGFTITNFAFLDQKFSTKKDFQTIFRQPKIQMGQLSPLPLATTPDGDAIYYRRPRQQLRMGGGRSPRLHCCSGIIR